MSDLQGRKVFKVFNQDFIVDERYNVTKELGQGAYGIVWLVEFPKHRKPSAIYFVYQSYLLIMSLGYEGT